MLVRLFVLSEGAQVDPQGRVSLSGLIHRLEGVRFPFQSPPFFVSVVLGYGIAERMQRVALRIELLDPDGRLLHSLMSDIRLLVGYADDPDNFPFNVRVENIVFDGPGDYEFRLLADGGIIATVPIVVALSANLH